MAFFEHAMTLDTDECILWPFYKNEDGYGRMGFNGALVYVHHLACERARGPCPPGMEVCHAPAAVCGHRNCFNKRHLRWDTHSVNAADQLKDGTIANSKLMKHQVNLIRQGLAAGEMGISLAARFGVTPSTISNIKSGKQWARVPAKRVIRRR